ncbi:hypothetical protein Tco_1011952, partial [Tanacetum coccineum]
EGVMGMMVVWCWLRWRRDDEVGEGDVDWEENEWVFTVRGGLGVWSSGDVIRRGDGVRCGGVDGGCGVVLIRRWRPWSGDEGEGRGGAWKYEDESWLNTP